MHVCVCVCVHVCVCVCVHVYVCVRVCASYACLRAAARADVTRTARDLPHRAHPTGPLPQARARACLQHAEAVECTHTRACVRAKRIMWTDGATNAMLRLYMCCAVAAAALAAARASLQASQVAGAGARAQAHTREHTPESHVHMRALALTHTLKH